MQMLEEREATKENVSSNKINAYFQSSEFINQQEQISLFIKNFPLIRLSEISSINNLIAILIKQNQLLGNKCQQNLTLVKEMYIKHQELLLKNKQLRLKIHQFQNVKSKEGQTNAKIDQLLHSLQSLKSELNTQKGKAQEKFIEIQQTNLGIQQFGLIFKDTLSMNHKKALERLKESENIKFAMDKCKQILSLQEIEKSLKEEKKRLKYNAKIKETSELFCNRLNKIIQNIPSNLWIDEFKKQTSSYLQIIEDLTLTKRNSMKDLKFKKQPTDILFQQTLAKYRQFNEKQTLTKHEITSEVQQLKKSLEQSQNYYETYLHNIKLELQREKREKEQIHYENKQAANIYEQHSLRLNQEIQKLKLKIEETETEKQKLETELRSKNDESRQLIAKLDAANFKIKDIEVQQREMKDQMIKKYEHKIQQKQQILNQEVKFRKEEKIGFQTKISQLKDQISIQESKLSQKQKEVKQLKVKLDESMENNTKGQAQFEKIKISFAEKKIVCDEITTELSKKIKQLSHSNQNLLQIERQKSLQAAYIKELEHKLQQAHQKLKSFENKRNQDKSLKKELTTVKQALVSQQRHSKQIQESYLYQKQENSKLKLMIKQMKKQLEQVYIQINSLKELQIDRERLAIEIQKSDRTKVDILRQYQNLKYELIRLQKQNKAIQMECRHYKNALNRIQALK